MHRRSLRCGSSRSAQERFVAAPSRSARVHSLGGRSPSVRALDCCAPARLAPGNGMTGAPAHSLLESRAAASAESWPRGRRARTFHIAHTPTATTRLFGSYRRTPEARETDTRPKPGRNVLPTRPRQIANRPRAHSLGSAKTQKKIRYPEGLCGAVESPRTACGSLASAESSGAAFQGAVGRRVCRALAFAGATRASARLSISPGSVHSPAARNHALANLQMIAYCD
jgi:hypothetical protein